MGLSSNGSVRPSGKHTISVESITLDFHARARLVGGCCEEGRPRRFMVGFASQAFHAGDPGDAPDLTIEEPRETLAEAGVLVSYGPLGRERIPL